MITLSYSTDIMQQIQSRKMNCLNTYKVDTERKQIQHYVNPETYNNATFIVVKKSPWNTVDKRRSALILEKNMCKIHFAMFNQVKVCIYILEKETATHSSILAQRIPQTEERGLDSTVHRVTKSVTKSQTRLSQYPYHAYISIYMHIYELYI